MTEPSKQLFLPYHTTPRSAYYAPTAIPDVLPSPSTSSANPSGSTQDFTFASSSSRSGVPILHNRQLLETRYYTTNQYPELSSYSTFDPRQAHEAIAASIYDEGLVAGGATAVEPSSISDASFSVPFHDGATHWYNPQQPSGEWTCCNSVASATLTDGPTWTELHANYSSSLDCRTTTSSAQWTANEATESSFECSSVPDSIDESSHRASHLGFLPYNIDADFGLDPAEGDHLDNRPMHQFRQPYQLQPMSLPSSGNSTADQSSSSSSPAPTASYSSAIRQSSQPYTRSTKETRLPSCAERRTNLVFRCEWDGCEEACNGLRSFKEHLKRVHEVPIGNSRTKNTKTCLWEGCGEPHIPDRGLFRHLYKALGVVVKCKKCTTWVAPRDDDTVLSNHLAKCWKGVVPDPSVGDVWEEVYKSG